MTKIIELRPDKSLIDQNFEKYQYSSDIVPIDFEKTLTSDAYRQEPGNTQDSWLEARLFAFHNHLFKNPYDSSCWFVDTNRDVWRLTKDGNLIQLHRLPTTDQSCLYNPSIVFPSKEIAVLSNGGKSLEIFGYAMLGDVTMGTESLETDEVTPGVLLDARCFPDKFLIIVVMCCIAEVDGKKCSQLVVLYLENGGTSGTDRIKITRKQILNVKGPVEYAYIESTGEYMHIMSQDTATFIYDSSKPIENKKTEDSEVDKKMKIPKYSWSQDEYSLTVWIKVAEKYQNHLLKIEPTATSISVCIEDNVLIQGDFRHRLDEKLTTWTREKDTIKLELMKLETGLMWSELLKGDTGGECVPNEALAAEIHTRLSHLCTTEPETADGQPIVGFNADQLEECDVEGQDNCLQRINLNDRCTTHLVMLGSSNHILFTQKVRSGQRLCLRHDNHGCVWIPREIDTEEWEIEHIDTFPGFGYVEASKTNKRFCVSPPNGSYVTIVEHTRHAFIYDNPEDSKPVSSQRIVDIGSDSAPIIGAAATDKYLILLTTKKLYRFSVYS